eukprot:6465254-Amphidinium_carterae.1
MMTVSTMRVMLTMLERISSNSLFNFDMVAELARSIVNRASQLWETIVLMHRCVLHRAVYTCGFTIGYIVIYLEWGLLSAALHDTMLICVTFTSVTFGLVPVPFRFQ